MSIDSESSMPVNPKQIATYSWMTWWGLEDVVEVLVGYSEALWFRHLDNSSLSRTSEWI